MKKNQNNQELILDLHNCNLQIISSKKKIQEFIDKLCPIIKMEKYGPLRIERFGQKTPFGEGYSFFQFIETSSISGHFLEINQTTYINIFSCQSFDTQKATQFTQKFFQAKKVKNRVIIRK